jgi:hypothetical protein
MVYKSQVILTYTFTPFPPFLNTRVLQLLFMDDKQTANTISLWCFEKDPGKVPVYLPPLPCKQEACERYRAEYPHCVMMSRTGRRGREYP